MLLSYQYDTIVNVEDLIARNWRHALDHTTCARL